MKMLKSKTDGVIDDEVESSMSKKTWDSNAITPGTPFMDILAASLRYWVGYKLNTDPGWAKVHTESGFLAEILTKADKNYHL